MEAAAVVTRQIAGRDIELRELSVAQIRAWLKAQEQPLPAVDGLLFADFTLADVSVFTSLSAAQVEDMRPSELRAVWDAVREVNADFFGMRVRLVTIAAGQMAPSLPGAPSD